MAPSVASLFGIMDATAAFFFGQENNTDTGKFDERTFKLNNSNLLTALRLNNSHQRRSAGPLRFGNVFLRQVINLPVATVVSLSAQKPFPRCREQNIVWADTYISSPFD